MNTEIIVPFDLKIGYLTPKNPIALAPMAGITDSKFAARFMDHAGMVILGGYNLDEPTNDAAQREVKRGRNEFVTDSPMEFLESELQAITSIDSGTAVMVNVRAADIEAYADAARLAKKYGAGIEINAHCRQPEMMELGAGESLLEHLDTLREIIETVRSTGAVVSVKIRAIVVDDLEVAQVIEQAGAHIIHIDAMGGRGADVNVIRKIRNHTSLFIIGNNSIIDYSSAKSMFSRGADMVSVARAVMDNPNTLRFLVEQVTSVQMMNGWYNSPKHICGGGDLRALTFCCLPVKPCAVHNALKQIGMSAEEFARLKLDFVKGTPLEYGDSTCFGSMAWCCKISKPCFLRDGVLEVVGVSDMEFMQIKKRMSQEILSRRKK
ncbi:MAG: methanogenesis marker 9 domain-containing protein [Methanosarcinales archaeon]|nr:methanogenesis marker 9 domain-containing protein [Methanosarcinales archaeon]